MKKKLNVSMHDTTLFYKTASRFDIDFEKLSVVLLDYIKNNNGELYYLRMSNLCGVYDPFIRQIIKPLIVECQDIYSTLGEISEIKLTGNKLIILYEDLENETDRKPNILLSELWYTP